jgi:serine/threonine protein kinase
MKISNHILKYYNHWYDDKYVYILMEYCSKGDLAEEIEKRIENKQKFSEKVFIFFFLLMI